MENNQNNFTTSKNKLISDLIKSESDCTFKKSELNLTNGEDIEKVIADISRQIVKPKLLLHVCCAPCFAGIIERLSASFDITAFFYNPNILPNTEFNLRFHTLKVLLAHFPQIKLTCPEQHSNEFLDFVKGLETLPEGAERCNKCFQLRLQKTAEFLSNHKDEYDCFATTLTISPHKNAVLINKIGSECAEKLDVVYLNSDFKKKDGFLNSIKFSKQLGLYRQNYCGCGFSND